MTARTFQSVLCKIRYLVFSQCKDIVLLGKWTSEFAWFDEFEQTKTTRYFNLAPEALEEMQWCKLGIVLDYCIGDSKMIKYDWEKRAVDIFLSKDAGADLPDNPLSYTFRTHYNRGYDVEYEYENAEGEHEEQKESD